MNWRPIATADKDADVILLTDGSVVDVGGWISAADQGADPEEEFRIAAGWWLLNCSEMRPTHWMPLPPPPVDAQQDLQRRIAAVQWHIDADGQGGIETDHDRLKELKAQLATAHEVKFMTSRQRRIAAKTPREARALDVAETLLEASGFRYQSSQIPGLALILVAFAEKEIELLPAPVDAQGQRPTVCTNAGECAQEWPGATDRWCEACAKKWLNAEKLNESADRPSQGTDA